MHLRLKPAALSALMRDARVPALRSLSDPAAVADETLTLGQTIEDKKGDDPTRRERELEWLRGIMGMNRVERLVTIMYYFEGLSMRRIGEVLDLSESRVSQMHSKLMQRMASSWELARPRRAGRETRGVARWGGALIAARG